MTCSACGHENRAGRKFCVECGAALALACAACSAPYEAGEKFCGECGAPLGAAPPRPAAAVERPPGSDAPPGRAQPDAGARQVVTIVFADLVGSTALHERLDAESARRVMERYYAALRAAVDAHGGTVVKLLGDGVMAAFGLKRVAEDDALRAVRAAAAMQEAFRALIRTEAAVLGAAGLRVAVNTGEVVVSGARDDVIGDPVNVAARLQEQGSDGDVVLGEATRRLVATRVTLAPLGSVTLKGRAEAVAAYRLESLEPPAGAAAAPFVGRDGELARLEAVYDAAVATPATRLAVLLGSPGLGKSRLIDELGLRHADGATILAAHCDAAGGATFAPLAQVLRGFLGLDEAAAGEAVRTAVAGALAAGDDGERARIAGGIAGLLGGTATSPEETFFVVRRFLAGLAAARPVVLVIDDLHWAEPLLLDLVEHLVQWGAGVPLFVLVGARPELRDLRSSLVVPSALVGEVVTLGGLDAGAAMRLAANVIGAADLPAAVAAKVLATSEGNPLFVGELVRMLVQEGALTKDGDRWTVGANLAALEMPPTIHALLAARIERLGSEERTVLERAAVVGRHFSRSAVAALLGRNGSELDARLESLRRSELIERDTGWLLGEPVLRFHHVLIRDAAYRRLLKGTRAELHARLADWIEGQVGETPEHDEMIGWHLEQAHQLLSELGPLDAEGAVLGERAARRLAAAGRRALARDDVSLAAGLLGRALQRLAADAPERADLVLDWCEALLAAGDVGPAADAIVELARVAGDASDDVAARLRAWHTCFAGQLTVLTAPEALHETADRVGAAARDLAALEDAAGEAKAHFVHAQALARLGKIGACEAALDQALAAARRAGDRRRANAVLAGAPLAALWGPSPVTRASGRCLDVVRVLRITQGAPAVEAVALSCQGVLEALRGRTEAARRMLASSRTMVEELGISHRLFETDVFAGRIDLLEGNAAAAERALRAGYDGLRDLGLGIDAARAAALLGRALLAQERPAEAETLSHESELLAGDDLQAAIAWRGVRAEALARRGDHSTAIALAEAAVAIAAATDALLDHADARLALAAALRAGGRQAEADAEERRAFELWEAKGATVLAERARRTAGRSESRPTAPAGVATPLPATRRRVAANAATTQTQAFDAAFAKGDAAAFAAMFTPAVVVVDHPTESTYGRDGAVESYERLLGMQSPRLRHEPIATLGASLGLFRRRIAAAGSGGGRFDVGAYDREEIVVIDAGLLIEIFAADRLGDAIARLYQRYAEAFPQGPERERAAVTTRVVAFMVTSTPGVTPAFNELWAPTSITVDHRSVGYGTLTGENSSKFLSSWRELAEGMQLHVDDVLALEPHGFVRKTTSSGVWREGGGAFERTVCMLSTFGADGRVTHHETFDADREADALARFDALTAGAPTMQPMRRRVRANASSRMAAEYEAICAARDFAALATFFDDVAVCIDHPTGATYGSEGLRKGIERLLQSPDARVRHTPIATLGESWALISRAMSASGSLGGRFDVGPYEIVNVGVQGTNERGRLQHFEIFAADRLGEAIACLYERHAETLPEGPERERATVAARAVAFILLPGETPDLDLLYAPTYVDADHRTVGYGTLSRADAEKIAGSFHAVSEDVRFRIDDVLALDTNGFVRQTTSSGVWREGGGAFERTVCTLTVFGPDGRVTGHETFDADRQAEALARFDALTADTASSKTPVQRRIRPNAVTQAAAEFERIVAARDFAALGAICTDDAVCVDHPTGATYGAAGMRTGVQRLMQSPDASLRCTPLATLGDSWGLVRREMAGSGALGGRFDVGTWEIVDLGIWDADERGRFRQAEIFAAERLGAAIVRLYERYAESLPDEAASRRARAIARSLAVFDGPSDFDRIANANAPSVEVVDQRILGTWSAHGREAWLTQWREHLGLSAESGSRYDAVLALEPTAILVHQTFFGVSRESGGDFENVLLVLHVFDGDGLIARTELFEPERTAEALARFDALTANAAPAPARRRLRPNAATATAARFEAAIGARDEAALADTLSETLTVVDHANGAEYGRDGVFTSFRRLLRMDDPTMHHEALATLGESLALLRRRIGGRGGRLDVGAFERHEYCVYEVDADGRFRHVETFAAERLRAALGRFYERYADSLPEGPARTRARGSAWALAAFDGPLDGPLAADRIANVHAPSFECVDHRVLATWSVRGLEEWRMHWRRQADLATGTLHDDEVLALDPTGIVVRQTFVGTIRTGGGAYENVMISVATFGADGLITRIELFEPDDEGAALARFDALSAGRAPRESVRRRVRPNAATRAFAALEQAFARRDLAAVDALLGDPLETIEHPTGTHYGREGQLESSRRMMRMPDLSFRIEPLATLGDAFCLARRVVRASGTAGGKFDVGAYEIDSIVVNGVDAAGRLTSAEVFASDHLCQAIARLYALYAESLPNGRERTRAAGIAASHAVWDGPLDDFDRFTSVFAPSFVCVDHRSLGTWSVEGRDEFMQHWRGQNELAAGFSRRDDDILALAPGANLTRRTMFGINRATGGPFENVLLHLDVFGADGLYTRCELFEPEQEAAALARYDALVGPRGEPTAPVPSAHPFANAATRSLDGVARATAARDWDGLADLTAPSLRFDDRRPLFQMQLGREGFLEQHRVLFDVPNARWTMTPIATRGERLTLARIFLQGEVTGGGGALEIDHRGVIEVDDDGRMTTIVLFEPAELDAAYAELDARYAAGEAAGCARAWAAPSAFAAAWNARDFDAILAIVTADYVGQDHRRLLWGSMLSDPAIWVRSLQLMVEMAPDFRCRIDRVVLLSDHGALVEAVEMGTRDGGAFETRYLWVTEVDETGRMARFDLYDLDQIDQARARFAALAAPAPSADPFDNAASRTDAELFRCFNARDWAGVLACAAPELVFDERRRLVRNTCGREVWLEQFRLLFDVPKSRFTSQLRATRGERLALNLHCFTGEVAHGGGPLALDGHLVLTEVDGDGRIVAIVLFDLEDADAAYDELDARYEAGEGAMHPPLTSGFRRALARRDWDAVAALCGPGFVEHDHRSLALLGTSRGAEAWTRNFRVQVDLAPDTVARFGHVRPCPRGSLATLTWEGSRDGGRYEIPMVGVTELDVQGKFARIDLYDPEQLDQARARFAELASPAPSAEPFANAASATAAPVIAAIIAHDWQRFTEFFTDDFRMSDRRRVVQLELDREQYVAFTREVADRRTIRASSELLATRGERLALTRPVYEFSDADVGPSEIAFLILTEVDERGRIAAYVRWDLEDLDAAYAELDARWAAGEAAQHRRASTWLADYLRAFAARDWTAATALMAPDLMGENHRLVGWGTLHGPAALVSTLQAQVELAPDTQERLDHVRTSEHAVLLAYAWHGTREGGAFENVWLVLVELDVDGRAHRIDVWEPEQLDRARVRLAEIAARTALEAPPGRFANAATRAFDEFFAGWKAREWHRFRALFAASFRYYDRTPMAQLELDGEQWIAFTRQLSELRLLRGTGTAIATRGERLALARSHLEMAEGDVGLSEINAIFLYETNARGEVVAVVRFDGEDLDAAYAELDRRWQAGDHATYPQAGAFQVAFDRALTRRDWDAIAALLALTITAHDHRLVGWDVRHGRAAYIDVLRAMVELAPDAQGRPDHARLAERGMLAEVVWVGTREGGAFESPFLWVVELDPAGLATRFDLYDPHHLKAALARYAEVERSAQRPSPVAARDPFAALATPNLATAAMERWLATYDTSFDTGNWDAMRALLAPEYVFDDRRRLALLNGDAELLIASARERVAIGAHVEISVVGTAGDRVSLFRLLWSGGPSDGRFEIEQLGVTEVDEAGRFVAQILFDADAGCAARHDVWRRWATIDPAVTPWTDLVRAAEDGFNADDRERMRARFAADVLVEDHRRTGFGRLEGYEAYRESLQVLRELAPDQHLELGGFWPALEPHGIVTTIRRFGTLADGGAFESHYLWLVVAPAGRITHSEYFEVEDVDRARVRLAELRPDPLRIPPNAATRAHDRPSASMAKRNAVAVAMDHWQAAYDAGFDTGNWEPLRAVCAPGFVFDDRRRLALISGDVDLLIASARERSASGARVARTQLGTAGGRIVIERWLLSGGPSDGRFEIEYLGVFEVDEAGLITAFVMFDPDGARAAQREAWARWAAIEPDMAENLTLLGRFVDAFNAHDLGAFLATMADDVVVEDHRRTGFGRLEGVGAYGASVEALWSLAPGTTGELGSHWPAYDRHGVLTVIRRHGGLVDGGEYESEYLQLFVRARERFVHFEMFEIEDLGTALARFAALRPDPLRIPPNAATRTRDRWCVALVAGDVDTIATLYHPSYRSDDRRPLIRLTTDLAGVLASDRILLEDGWRPARTVLATAGDRLALQRMLWTVGEAGAHSEVEILQLSEVDGEGRLVSGVTFDPADRAAASVELFERYAASGADGATQEQLNTVRAWNAHDMERLRALLPVDFYLDDRRRTGVGRLDGVDAYLASVAALWELSRDVRTETLYTIEVASHGRLYVSRWFGTNAEGGEFDSVYVCVGFAAGDRGGLEIFELDDLELARARFATLRA